jgi:hypothetical protein
MLGIVILKQISISIFPAYSGIRTTVEEALL